MCGVHGRVIIKCVNLVFYSSMIDPDEIIRCMLVGYLGKLHHIVFPPFDSEKRWGDEARWSTRGILRGDGEAYLFVYTSETNLGGPCIALDLDPP